MPQPFTLVISVSPTSINALIVSTNVTLQVHHIFSRINKLVTVKSLHDFCKSVSIEHI